ncbi:hypothetical protein IJI91_00920 [Candidatus Saccharibacteria bacterium]|nr:hypothetical protein [Candidatus Saccharibacteria bacterium]
MDIDIVEMVNDGSGSLKPWQDITDAMPGMTYSAIPRVKNNGSMLAEEVRMCLSESATNSGGGTIVLPANTFGININSTNWLLDNDGTANPADPATGNCYKYNSNLASGAITEPLFSEVTLSPALGNEYQGATFNLHIEAWAKADSPDTTNTTENPDTGVNTAEGSFVSAIPYILGGLALLVVLIHLLRVVFRKGKRTN